MKLIFNRKTKGEKMTEALRGVYEALREEVDRESMKAAMREGMEKGIEEGRARGMEEGRVEGVLSSLVSLVKDGLISVSKAAKRADMSEENFKKYLE